MRKFIFWPAVLLLTLFIGALTYIFLNSSLSSQVQQSLANTNTETVVVATKNIALRRSIIETDLAIREVPIGMFPEGTATSIDEVVGMMATSDIFSGEIVLTQQLAVAGEVIQQIALTIPDNKVLVPIPIRSQLVSIGLVKPGDRVDLFGTFIADEVFGVTLEDASVNLLLAENAAETIAVLRDLEIHAIIIEPALTATVNNSDAADEETDGVFHSTQEGEQAILVALEKQDSVVVKHLLGTESPLDIALRSPNEGEMADVTNVDIFYLADRYGIKLVYGDPVTMTEEVFQANPGEFIFTGSDPSPEFLAAIDQQ